MTAARDRPRLLFMGRKHHGAEALRWSLSRGIPVVGVLTDHHLPGSPTAAVAREHGLPLLTLEEATAAIEAGTLRFELAVSYVYWRILRAPLLGAARLGVINFHPAPLPELRGTGGYNVAILDGHREYGVTAHYVDEGIDTGPIIECCRFPIDLEHETAVSLEARSQAMMGELYRDTIERVLEHGRLPTTPNEGGRYVSRREMEELKRIQPGDDVSRKIRAFWFPPYGGAWIEHEGRRYTLVDDALLRQLSPEPPLFPRSDEG